MAAFRISASAFMAAMALMGILALPGPAMGQPLPGEQEAMVAEANELLEDLTALREQALAENPSLATRQEELEDLVTVKMQEAGLASPREALRELRSMAGELQDMEADSPERAERLEEYQAFRRQVMQAREEAMQDREVQRAEARLRDRLIEVMGEIDPEAPAMIERFDELREELSGIREGSQSGG